MPGLCHVIFSEWLKLAAAKCLKLPCRRFGSTFFSYKVAHGNMSKRKLDTEDEGQGPFMEEAPPLCDLFAEDPGFPPDEGPTTREQMFRWQCFALDRLKKAGLLQNVVDKFCEHGVVMSTDYSGVGTAEAALSYIHTALKRMGFPDVDETVAGEPAVRISAAGDLSPHCRFILGNHKQDDMFAPECSLSRFF